MKAMIKGFFFILLMGILVLPVAGVGLSIQKEPAVRQHQNLSFDNVKRVKALVDKTRPAYMKRRQIRVFKMNEPDLNLLAGYAVSQGLKIDTINSKISLSDNTVKVDVTVMIPSTPLGSYINMSLDMKSTGTALSVLSFQIGRILVPGRIIHPVLKGLHQYLLNIDVYRNLMEHSEAIKQILINPDQLLIIYEWDPDSLAKLQESSKTILLPMDQQERLIFYHNKLAEILKPYNRNKISLARVMAPMFKHALDQSNISDDPVRENRALLQSLALFSTRTNLSLFISQSLQKKVLPAAKAVLILKGRKDLPKHFLVSAGLSVSAGSSLADFIGLAKEVEDSDKGSGFSFADLAADKAGVKLGQVALASKQSARTLQEKMSVVQTEDSFMPAIDHLPEGIMALEFKKRYTDLDSKKYSLVKDEIDKRIYQCLVYQ